MIKFFAILGVILGAFGVMGIVALLYVIVKMWNLSSEMEETYSEKSQANKLGSIPAKTQGRGSSDPGR